MSNIDGVTMRNPKFAHLHDAINKCARTRLKAAAPGGSQEQPFEQAFASIASAYINEKAPSLLDYQVGFQLLDRNEEDTKAVGIFGFKVGHQWLYAPVFFLNGDLKGHELLYIKNQDIFIPLKENQLNYILNKKPNVLGSPTDRNMRAIGVQQPNLTQLSRSPSKYASAYPTWLNDAMPAIAYAATTHPGKDEKYKDLIDLPTFLKKEGKAVVRSLVLGFQENPKLSQAFQNFHDLSIIDEALKEAEANAIAAESQSVLKVKIAHQVDTPITDEKSVLSKLGEVGKPLDKGITYAGQRKLQIFTYDSVMEHGTNLEDLNDKERSKLLKDKVVIRDDRDDNDVVTAYEVQSTVRLQNPSESGLYDVLVKPDKFEKCLVIIGPYCERGTRSYATLVKVEKDNGGHSWLNTHPGNIWVGHQYKREDYIDWWNGLKDAENLSADKDSVQIIVGIKANGTVPFSVRRESVSGDRKVYDVWYKSYANNSRPAHLPPIDRGATDYLQPRFDGERLILSGKIGGTLRATGEDVVVPKDFKVITLTQDKDKDDEDNDGLGFDTHGEPVPIELANQLDIDLMLGTKTASVKIYHTGMEVEIAGRRMQKLAALIHLVRDWKLREKTARMLLERAHKEKVARFRVKKADQYYDHQRSGPSAPNFPEAPTGYDPLTAGRYPTNNLGEWNINVADASGIKTDPYIYNPLSPSKSMGVGGSMGNQTPSPDHHAQQAALDAAGTGQKEIFDMSMIGSLLKAVRDDSMVDRYMGDLQKGLDRLGRILFLFYWHNEKFADRYGKDEMVELEDGLRNAFEYLGDITLFLKQRSIEGSDDNDVNLSNISD
jgi:hypothetical protein